MVKGLRIPLAPRITIIGYIGPEEDIIEAFVRHNFQFTDRMVLHCTAKDETWDIIQKLIDEGMPIECIYSPSNLHDQARVLTRALHAERDNCDWIIPLDADEFLVGKDVRVAFGHMPTDKPVRIPWKTYVPLPKDPAEELNVLRRIRHRRQYEPRQLYKITVPSACLKRRYALDIGNHHVISTWSGHVVAEADMADIAIAHFPVRSIMQLQRKVRTGWERMMHHPDKREGQGFHWQELYEKHLSSPLTEADLTHIALRYSCKESDPTTSVIEDLIPCGFPLRYTKTHSPVHTGTT